MRRSMVGLTVVSFFILGICAARAAPEIFTKPTYKGDRLAWCKDWGSGCGKDAANAYCAHLGFGDAADFAKDPNIGDRSPTHMIGNNQICNKPYCDGFKFISCGKKDSSGHDKKSFDKPRWKGFRLDWCASKGAGCGKDAAEIFCKANGFNKPVSFKPDLRVGLADPTRMIVSGAICNTVICTGFQNIVCVR